MIVTKEITLSMKNQINRLISQERHFTSAHVFESLYIWKKDMNLSIYLTDDMFAVKYGLRGTNSWFFPCGAPEAVHDFLHLLLQDGRVQLNYLREEDARYLMREFPDQFDIIETPEDSEYLFSRNDLLQLSGKQYAAFRKYIHRLEREHEISFLLLDEQHIQKALDICSQWNSNIPNSLHDVSASQTLLKEHLFSAGVLILVDQKPCAIAAGYSIYDDIFDISLAKNLDDYSDLSIYAIYVLARLLPDRCTILNGEEDLGIPGIRMVKEKLRPSGMIRMFQGTSK